MQKVFFWLNPWTLSLVFGWLLTTLPKDSQACTAFLMTLEDQLILGKSYDWDFGNGLVAFNPRGISKINLSLTPQERPARWVSSYDSLTLNQYGLELPLGGINEKGLVVEILWMAESEYPQRDLRPTLNELQFIQYALDNFRSVEEMVQKAQDNRVSALYAKVHYFVADPKGHTAVFEFLNGNLVIATGKKMPVPVLTNNTYADSLGFLKKQKDPAQTGNLLKGRSSLARFQRAALLLNSNNPEQASPVKQAFFILDQVSMGDYSKWNLVYEIKSGRLHFRTRDQKNIKSVTLSDFRQDCTKPSQVLDINTSASGNVFGLFADFSVALNKKSSASSWQSISSFFSKEIYSKVMSFPLSFECVSPKKPSSP